MDSVRTLALLAAASWLSIHSVTPALGQLPVDREALSQLREVPLGKGVRNLISIHTIWSALHSAPGGLAIDLSGAAQLLDGSTIDPAKIYGWARVGPYPFEAAEARFAYKRFRKTTAVASGKGTVDVGYLLAPKHNSEQWTDHGTVAVRLELFLEQPGRDRPLGVYDTFAAFRKTTAGFDRLPWITEGPFVHLITSDQPTDATVGFLTNEETRAEVLVDGRQPTVSGPARNHVVHLSNLQAGTEYTYRVRIGQVTTRPYHFRTAPAPGQGPVRLAFCGDSREGQNGGMTAFMGVNHDVFERLSAQAYARGAQMFLVGGDLINGYTTQSDDFRTQLHAWKQAISGFWNERPVYVGMGNHECLLRVYRAGRGNVQIDRWPYQTDSAEVVFSNTFLNPQNGPEPSDSRRPPYRGNVYSFRYGLLKVIAFNNNYWFCDRSQRFGGAPEGYILDDQMQWIEAELKRADSDPTVRYVILFAQEPVFPCGGHAADAMWYYGNNNVRAFTFSKGTLKPEPKGILEVRNRFARSVAACNKVAAVLCGDEHAYHRVRIDRRIPVGDPPRDDTNGNGRIEWKGDEPASPLRDLQRPVWYVTCGGGGAPYYSEESTPWTEYWKRQEDPRAGYFYSSQENVLIVNADAHGISLRSYNVHGELIDELDNIAPTGLSHRSPD